MVNALSRTVESADRGASLDDPMASQLSCRGPARPMSDEAEFENEQLRIVEELVGRSLAPVEHEGFRIVYPRFIDRFGGTRLPELRNVFRSDLPAGRAALAASLRRVAMGLGSYDAFAARYPVTIIPPLPAYPLFPIADIATFQPCVYRVLSSTNLPAMTHIRETGCLLPVPRPVEPVLRSVPRGHWCTYDAWSSPDETRRALQILPEWSDCRARSGSRRATSRVRPSSRTPWTRTISKRAGWRFTVISTRVSRKIMMTHLTTTRAKQFRSACSVALPFRCSRNGAQSRKRGR
jgi:hypothetical protein